MHIRTQPWHRFSYALPLVPTLPTSQYLQGRPYICPFCELLTFLQVRKHYRTQSRYGFSHALPHLPLHMVFTYRVDFIYALSAFIALPFYPMSVEVGTESIKHFARKLVILPLPSIKLQNIFSKKVFPFLKKKIKSCEVIQRTPLKAKTCGRETTPNLRSTSNSI